MTAPYPAGWQLLDLHNHSDRSYDAANRLSDYEERHSAGRFDVLAITDHNRLDGALDFAERATFPVIVGIEVDTGEGELIGLFLTEPVPPRQGARASAEAIRGQGGLVYLQHPFYPLVRKPLRPQVRDELAAASLLDIVEIRNGGPFTRRSDEKARKWAAARDLPVAGSSDAHEPADIGRIVTAVPPGPLTPEGLLERLRRGVIIDRHRNSLAQIATKARYRFFAEIPRRARREPRRRRLP
jgi:predicted metal-dependent phosphoesterase TrpH